MKILIAEDDAMSRRLLQKTLERAGYEVQAVENGRLAQEELCRSDGPRLALLDWEMPEVDGLGVCRAVRDRKEKAYVYMIFLTSKESSEDKVAGLRSGADDYLTKPLQRRRTQSALAHRLAHPASPKKIAWWKRAKKCAFSRPLTIP